MLNSWRGVLWASLTRKDRVARQRRVFHTRRAALTSTSADAARRCSIAS